MTQKNLMENSLAQKLIISIAADPTTGINPEVIEGPLKNISTVGDIINLIVLLIFPLAGIILFIFLVWGGFSLITSRGDPEKVSGAKSRITSAIIGFILLFLSYFLVSLVARILGLGQGIL